MLANEAGALSGSDLYLQTPSDNARRMLFYMTACGYFFTNYDYHITRDDYNSYLILYVCSGRLSVRCDSKRSVVTTGQVAILNCHVPHEYYTIGDCEFIWLHMDGVTMDLFYDQILRTKGSLGFECINSDAIREQIYSFVYSCRNDQFVNAYQQSIKLYKLIISILDETNNESAEEIPLSASTERAIKYIDEHYAQPITIPEIADLVNLSQFHFSRTFKKDCGYSPHEYLMMTRMNRAMYLLKTTDTSVKDIAYQVGYQNVATFTAAFTERVGLSPGKFRKFPF